MDETLMDTTRQITDRVVRWVDEAVIGLDLCPFASSVRRSGELRVLVHGSPSESEAVHAVLGEARSLLEGREDGATTTLVVLPRTAQSFEAFLDLVATVEAALSQAGADGLLQVATFHPDYRFEGAAQSDPANFTNRAPHPIVHLLRESDVSQAVEGHPDPHGIPEANVARLRGLGRAALEARWSRWKPPTGPDDL